MELYANRLRAGVHFGPDYTAAPRTEVVEHPVTGEKTERTVYPIKQFNKGDVVYDKADLVSAEPGRWETPTGPRRRETVTVGGGAEAAALKANAPTAADEKAKAEAAFRAELETMSVADLKAHAKELGVQLHGAKTQADMVEAILKGDPDSNQ